MRSKNLIKMTSILALAGLMAAPSIVGAAPAKRSFEINIDKKPIAINREIGYPYINQYERTMVPIRVISENMGYKVDWNQENKIVTVKDSNKTMFLKIGKTFAVIDGKRVALESNGGQTKAEVVENRTYVPLRFVSENFGARVDYKQEPTKHIIDIYKNSKPEEKPDNTTKPDNAVKPTEKKPDNTSSTSENAQIVEKFTPEMLNDKSGKVILSKKAYGRYTVHDSGCIELYVNPALEDTRVTIEILNRPDLKRVQMKNVGMNDKWGNRVHDFTKTETTVDNNGEILLYSNPHPKTDRNYDTKEPLYRIKDHEKIDFRITFHLPSGDQVLTFSMAPNELQSGL